MGDGGNFWKPKACRWEEWPPSVICPINSDSFLSHIFHVLLADVGGPLSVMRVSCADGVVVSSGVEKTPSLGIKHPSRS